MKKIFQIGFIAIAAVVLSACVNDLDVEIKNPTMTTEMNVDQLLGKIYNTLGTTGQRGPDGSGDLSGFSDEGMSSFYRMTFAMNEYSSDLIHWIWPDVGLAELRSSSWTSSNEIVYGAYARIYFDITLCNTFLDVASTDEKTKRAEVRFIRALNYWYLLDFFGSVPFNMASSENTLQPDKEFPTEIKVPGTNNTIKLSGDFANYPHQISRADLYEWLIAELKDIEGDLMDHTTRMNTAYYRVDQGAAWILLSRLYLNSAIYSPNGGTAADYTAAAEYSKKAIDTYELAPVYKHLFMADNDDLTRVNEAYKEIILPVNQDGAYTRSWGNSLFLIASLYTTGMPYWGSTEGWKCIRSRQQLVNLFFPNQENYKLTAKGKRTVTNKELMAEIESKYGANAGIADTLVKRAGDDRAMLCNYNVYGGNPDNGEPDTLVFACNMGMNMSDADDEFRSGWAIQKYSNLMVDPARKPTDAKFPDTDIPLIRAAEAYLTYAEAVLRGGSAQGMTADDAINAIRKRANASEKSGYALEEVLDEWGREFYCEGRRRVDLIRFGVFTGDEYTWELKAGKAFQGSIEDFRTVFPIPQSDIVANPNLKQNAGY